MTDKNFTKHIRDLSDLTELGKLDRSDFKKSYNSLSKIALNNFVFQKSVELATYWQQVNIKKLPASRKLIQAYAEGLQVSEEQVYSAMIIPEMVASFNKWIPNLLGLVPGCSSVFARDRATGGTIHARILDYSLGVVLTKSQRAMHIHNEKAYDVFGYTSVGFPLASMSSMNEKGLSLAIHYKHGAYFNTEGSSIFEIAYDLLTKCATVSQVRKRIKRHQSISHWGLYICDQQGEVAAVDIRGNEIFFENYQIDDVNYLYFNNKVINLNKQIEESQPFGHIQQCKMRADSFAKSFKKNKPKSHFDYLRTLTQIDFNESSYSHAPVTTATVQAYSFNTQDFSSYYLDGDSPKVNNKKCLYTSDVFKENFIAQISDDTQEGPHQKGLRHLSLAQYYFDLKDDEKVYFQLQMAKARLKNTSFEEIVKFYFCVVQYLKTDSKEELYYLLKEFQILHSRLPAILQDHCKLFEFRVLKLLKEKYHLRHFQGKIKHSELKVLLEKEHKLRRYSLRQLRKLIYPRIELLDIIYAYI